LCIDARLRVGESLLQVIEKAGQTFTGQIAQSVGKSLLDIAGRRAYRAKNLKRQQKEAALAAAKVKDFTKAWDGIDPN
ncbi:hypothetical protein, partial [Escherichia coli]|uniref:hypothetical protein n=1 Tax=Escherichia coli TaxID=562 RepID=UPI0019667A80